MTSARGALLTAEAWVAVQVHPNRERVACASLRVRGYDVLNPTSRLRRQWSDRAKVATRPLFPGYLFCQLSAGTRASIVSAAGVIRIVGDQDGPLPIDHSDIASIERIVAKGVPVEPWTFVPPGQQVYIDRGPLAGTRGTLLRVDGDYRLVVSIQLLQRSCAVVLDPAWVSVTPS